ncbi:type 11 methyltransferase [Nitzschia inconspicua]|uniref:Type 11 methyltransferase n=1 Tax=Nitzschia inconspicua TaxID=303405 RepID=A0A9K3LSS6_9STRA|nr:type 11 methyltransferase [Nitzschia inconspicua]
MASSATAETNKADQWSDQAELYSNQAARLTELHGADLVTILKDDILQAKTILDVGCGTGAFAKAYMKQFPKGVPGQTLILTDLSEGMLEKAKETINPGSDFQTKLVFQVEDGTKLDGIADHSIDVVVSLFGVFLIPDVAATLNAVARVLKKEPSNVFANVSWMFDVSEYFSSRGFGVSLQDVFKLPNEIIDPDQESMAYLSNWSTTTSICELLADRVDQGKLRCYPAIHNTVWEFDSLWTMLSKNPMSAIPNASTEDVAKAKKALEEFVTHSGALSLDEPMMLSTASILTVAREFRSV